MHSAWHNAYVRLGLVFLVLVLAPSFFLGYFSLRAVESEKRARAQRILEDFERYAEFASRAVRHELVDLESSWQELLPARAGWDRRDPAAGLRVDLLGERYVRTAWLLRAHGTAIEARDGEPVRTAPLHPAPAASEARLFLELAARGEAAEFEDAPAAAAAYEEILRRIRNPRLRAIAHASLGRVRVQQERWDEALAEYQRLLAAYPDVLDLDNQPLRFLARLQVARVLEARAETGAATAAALDLLEDLVASSDAVGGVQYDFFLERLESQIERLWAAEPPGTSQGLRARYAALRQRAKQPAGPTFFLQKLERKLVRAVMDEQPYSLRMRYVSDVVDDQPYLLAYVFLPDASETRVTGLLGFQVDLDRLSNALLPRFLRELELSDALWLEVVDEAGRRVIGESGPRGGGPIATSNLGEPFAFWSVAVHSRTPDRLGTAVDFRTKVFLYLILVLLLTIVAGAAAVALGLRREARLAALKTTFVSNVSHELRTPLTSIRMYAEMLEMQSADSEPERRRSLAVIRAECRRLERLIDTVLDFASLARGAKQYRFEYEEIGTLVQAVAAEFREQALGLGFEYHVDVEPDLPEVCLDADAVRQVLLNLLSNAVKYSEDERWIRVRAFRQGSEVGVQVHDRGIGIDPREHERIFDDFYRVEGRLVGERQGVGLGLTLVRRIVTAHGGRVSVQSALGQGACFSVWLPVEPASAGASPRGRVAAET